MVAKWTAVHHAFTSPKPEYLDSFDKEPGEALAYAYDIVCNGNEWNAQANGLAITDRGRTVYFFDRYTTNNGKDKVG